MSSHSVPPSEKTLRSNSLSTPEPELDLQRDFIRVVRQSDSESSVAPSDTESDAAVSTGDSDAPPPSLYDVVPSASFQITSLRLNLKRRVASATNKTDCASLSLSNDHSDNENRPPNVGLANPNNVAHRPDLESGSGSRNLYHDKHIKRNLYVKIGQADLDKYDLNFFDGSEDEIHEKVKDMCHSLRFWLCAKFWPALPDSQGMKKSGLLTKSQVCRFLGISFDSFKRYQPKILSKTFENFDGLSPLEYNNLRRCTHGDKIEELALNSDNPIIKSIIKKNKNKSKS